jgi:hypothetical protein
MSEFTLSQLMQAVERMIMVATVTARDGDRAKVKWADGAESDWLKIAQLGSEELKFWIPPSVGTQVVVLSPGGNTAHGIIYPGPFAGGVPAGNFAGTITGAGDMVVSEISVLNHTHSGVVSGSSETSRPK